MKLSDFLIKCPSCHKTKAEPISAYACGCRVIYCQNKHCQSYGLLNIARCERHQKQSDERHASIPTEDED